MFHIVVAGEYLIGAFPSQYHRNVIRSALAGEVTGDCTAHQRRVVAFQLPDDFGQCFVVVVFGEYQLMVSRADVFGCNAGGLQIVALVTVLVFHSHNKGMQMGDILGGDGGHQAAVQAAAAE